MKIGYCFLLNTDSTEFKAKDILEIIFQLEEEEDNGGAAGGNEETLYNCCKEAECEEEDQGRNQDLPLSHIQVKHKF